MKEPKYTIGQMIEWKRSEYVIQGIRNYQDYCWVYDFFPTRNTIVPFHFTGIPESEISPAYITKKWWKFWQSKGDT